MPGLVPSSGTLRSRSCWRIECAGAGKRFARSRTDKGAAHGSDDPARPQGECQPRRRDTERQQVAAEQDALLGSRRRRTCCRPPASLARARTGSAEPLSELTRQQQEEGASPGFEHLAPTKEASGC